MSEAILIYKKTFSGNSFVVLGDATADDFLNWDGQHPCKLNSRIFSALDNVKLDAFVTDLDSATIADWDQENWFHCIFHSYFWYGYKLTGTLYEEDSTTVLGLGSAGLTGPWYPFNFSFVAEDLTYGNDDPTLDGTYGYFKIVDITYRGPQASDGGLTGKWEIDGTLALSTTGTGDPAKYIYFHDVMDFNNITGAYYTHTEYYYTSSDEEEPYVGHEVVGNYHHFGQKNVAANASLYFLGNTSTQYTVGQTGNIWITGKAKTSGKIQVLSGIPGNPVQSFNVTAGEEFKFCYGPIQELYAGERWFLKTTTGTTLDYIEVLASKFDPPVVPDMVPESYAIAGSGQNSCVKALSDTLGTFSYHSRLELSRRQSSSTYDIPADVTNVRTVIWFHNSEVLSKDYIFYLYYAGTGFTTKQSASSYTVPSSKGWHRICVEDFLPEGDASKSVYLYAMSEDTEAAGKFDMIISSTSWTPAGGEAEPIPAEDRFVLLSNGVRKARETLNKSTVYITSNTDASATDANIIPPDVELIEFTYSYVVPKGTTYMNNFTIKGDVNWNFRSDDTYSGTGPSEDTLVQGTVILDKAQIDAKRSDLGTSNWKMFVTSYYNAVKNFNCTVTWFSPTGGNHYVGYEVVGDTHHRGIAPVEYYEQCLFTSASNYTTYNIPAGHTCTITIKGNSTDIEKFIMKRSKPSSGTAENLPNLYVPNGDFLVTTTIPAIDEDSCIWALPYGDGEWLESWTVINTPPKVLALDGAWDYYYAGDVTVGDNGKSMCNTLGYHGSMLVSDYAETDRYCDIRNYTGHDGEVGDRLDITVEWKIKFEAKSASSRVLITEPLYAAHDHYWEGSGTNYVDFGSFLGHRTVAAVTAGDIAPAGTTYPAILEASGTANNLGTWGTSEQHGAFGFLKVSSVTTGEVIPIAAGVKVSSRELHS